MDHLEKHVGLSPGAVIPLGGRAFPAPPVALVEGQDPWSRANLNLGSSGAAVRGSRVFSRALAGSADR